MDAPRDNPDETGPSNSGPGAAPFGGSARAFRFARAAINQPSWIHRAIAFVVLLVLIGVAATLLVWGLVIGAVVVGGVALVVGARALWLRLVPQRGAGDTMRRNVRVVRRGTEV